LPANAQPAANEEIIARLNADLMALKSGSLEQNRAMSGSRPM
jgi:hypothetical protein